MTKIIFGIVTLLMSFHLYAFECGSIKEKAPVIAETDQPQVGEWNPDPGVRVKGNMWELIQNGSAVIVDGASGTVCTQVIAFVLHKGEKVAVSWDIIILDIEEYPLDTFHCTMYSDYNGFQCEGSTSNLIVIK